MSHSNPLSKLFLSVTAGILCSMPAAAQADNTLDIYPLPAVFSAQKDDLAVQNFLQQNRETLVEDFVGQVTKNFPNTVNGFLTVQSIRLLFRMSVFRVWLKTNFNVER